MSFLESMNDWKFVLRQKISKRKSRAMIQKYVRFIKCLSPNLAVRFSAIEYQRISQWLEEDKYQPDLIQFALREAVLNQAYSLNYIDRILLSWERKNITSKRTSRRRTKTAVKQFMQKENLEQTNGPVPKIPYA